MWLQSIVILANISLTMQHNIHLFEGLVAYSVSWLVHLWLTPPWHFKLHWSPCLKQEHMFIAQLPLQLQLNCLLLSTTFTCLLTIEVDHCPSLSLMRGRYIQSASASPWPIDLGVSFYHLKATAVIQLIKRTCIAGKSICWCFKVSWLSSLPHKSCLPINLIWDINRM